ncbi:MAG: hypothetical protein HUJ62_01340, partial [Streptococcus gallolyticus]|nr:hypothetical protein [Streptococcus gallolyticus]
MFYIKKILNQDIAKEIAFTPEPSLQFFKFPYNVKDTPRREMFFTYKPLEGNGFPSGEPISVVMRDHVEKNESKITAGLARFLKDNLHVEKGDLLIIQNDENDNTQYEFDLIKPESELYDKYNLLMETSHTLIVTDIQKDYEQEDNTMPPTKPYTPLNYIPLTNDQKIKEYNRIIFGAPGTG